MSDITRLDGTVIFNGKTLTSDIVKMYVDNIDKAPSKARDVTDIPYKNGGVIIDKGYYNNVSHSYSVIINSDSVDSTKNAVRELKHSLLADEGYLRLEDSWNDDEYYLAFADGEIDFKFTPDRRMAKAVISFNRKPQRFLKSGDTAITITSSNYTLKNEYMPSRPLIRAYPSSTTASSSIIINGYSANIGYTSAAYIDIDYESGQAISSTGTYIGYTGSGNQLRELVTGNNTIRLSNLSKIELKPRWWRL